MNEVKRKKFKVIGQLDTDDWDITKYKNECTRHYNKEVSKKRIRELKKRPKVRYLFIVDKGHPNGSEAHFIFDDAAIEIRNLETKKLITILFARPGQIKRYGVEDEDIVTKARQNQREGRNK